MDLLVQGQYAQTFLRDSILLSKKEENLFANPCVFSHSGSICYFLFTTTIDYITRFNTTLPMYEIII